MTEEERKKVLKKWSKLGFLDGLEVSDEQKKNIAKLYDGQARHLLNEISSGRTEEVIEKWDKSGLLKGLKGLIPEDSEISKLMESHSTQLLREEKEAERKMVIFTSKEVMDDIDHEIIEEMKEKYSKDEDNDKIEGEDSVRPTGCD